MDKFQVGVVVIGRNEGDRLRECLNSARQHDAHIVYVDSGSSDESTNLALSLGCDVVELDVSRPFTAGRGRNAGTAFLLTKYPHIEFVQFIDGDCILDPQWLKNGLAKLNSDEKIAVVCGRRRERYPHTSIYNLLADMEWNTPIGEATQCGGDALIRASAFKDVEGYDNNFAAGEEPEMCYRMRQPGWKIWRLDAEMVLHDADMTKFSQWWLRSKRSGSAYAQSAWVHWRDPERFCLRDSFSIWLWALFVPIIAIALAAPTFGLSLGLFLAYPVLTSRIYRYRRNHGDSRRHSALYAIFCIMGKWPQLLGQMRFLRTRQSSLIEYKGPEVDAAAQAELQAAFMNVDATQQNDFSVNDAEVEELFSAEMPYARNGSLKTEALSLKQYVVSEHVPV